MAKLITSPSCRPYQLCQAYQSCQAFTLLEVLIALVIVATALIALVKASDYNIVDTEHLQQKTMAMIVASNRLAEVQLGIDAQENNQSVNLLNHRFMVKTTLTPALSTLFAKDIQKVSIAVSQQSPQKSQGSSLVNLVGYMTVH